MLTISYDGAVELCNQWTTQLYAVCHLYVNDFMITPGTVIGDFVEADFPGYSPVNIYGWSPAIIQSGNAITWSDPIQFMCASTTTLQQIYGYYVTRGTPSRYLWGQARSQGPIPIQQAGDVVNVLPSITLFTTA